MARIRIEVYLANTHKMKPAVTVAAVQQQTLKPETQRQYSDIKKRYWELRQVKKHDVRLYTDEYIFAELGRQFYKSPRTIENIVWDRI